MKFHKYLFLLLFFISTPCVTWAAANATHAKEELQQLRNRIEALQKKIAGAEESRNEAADALRESERAISDANRELADLENASRTVSQRVEALRGESDKASGTLAGQQALLSRLLYQQHVQHGGAQPEALRLLLSGANPNDIARELHYLGYVSRARADAIRGLRDNIAKLKSLSDEAAAKAAELAAIAAEQVGQRKRLETEKRKHADVLTRLSRDIQRQRQEVGTLQRNETRLTRLIEQLARIVTRPPPAKSAATRPRDRNDRVPEPGALAGAFSKLRGQLALPVRGELAGRFGSPRSDGGLTWKGLLLAAKAGEPVRAVATGRVVYADWLRGFGNLLIIDHGEGYMSLYGYNETLLKRVGDDIGGGDAVATVGNSGGGAESGLYFELRHQGKPFDPMTWIRGR
ncbi:MAG: peptidoglycan DD-metalloendopeptidase family protein [Burkholderiales bacterium]